jgi:transcriptional regulator with XRE-family HTH domain
MILLVWHIDIRGAGGDHGRMETEYFYEEFGRRLRAARRKAKLTQEELATRAGMSRPSLANVERGKQRVALHQFAELAAATGADPADLLPAREGLAVRLGRAASAAKVPAEVAAWGARAVGRMEREDDDGAD